MFTQGITALIETGAATRFNDSQFSGLKANHLLIDVIMTPTSGASWSFEDLKNIYLNVNMRQKNADDIQLMDNVRIYDALAFSDFEGGVSMKLDGTIKSPKTSAVEISGKIDFGFIQLGNEESVEILVTGTPVTNVGIQINCKWVYLAEKQSRIFGYKSYKSTGGEQADRDCVSLIILEPAQELNATIRDLTGSNTVNVRDAVSYANSIGRFETFTDFGVLYSEPFGVSQDISIRLDAGKNLLLQSEFFDAGKVDSKDADTTARYESVLQNIYSSKPEKYKALMATGRIPSSFVARG